MSLSKFNARKVEDHRYVYYNSIVKTEFCEDIGIKSTNTFYDAIRKFEKLGLLVDCKEEGYYLLYVQNWVEVKIDTLVPLLNWAKVKEDEIDLLRVFLVLKLMNDISQNAADRSFTVCDMLKILGHSTHRPENYQKVKYYLALLSSWGLISLKRHSAYGNNKKPYTIYHLEEVKEYGLSEDFYTDILNEMDKTALSPEMTNKLTFSYPHFMTNKEIN